MQELDRGAGVALWRQIADRLGDEIRRDMFAPGNRLPTELQLAQRFGVNRHTVRRAVDRLQDDGLLRVEQGRGTFVHEPMIEYPIGKRTRFSENIRRAAARPDGEVLRTAIVPADADMADALAMHEGAAVVFVETLSRVNDRPVSLGAHHFSARRFPGMIDAFRETRSVTAVLKGYGIDDYTRRETRVIARSASTEEARLLQMAKGRPLLVTEAINVDAAGRPLEYGIARFAGERIQIVFES